MKVHNFLKYKDVEMMGINSTREEQFEVVVVDREKFQCWAL